MADNNEDNTNNIAVPDPQVEDEGPQVEDEGAQVADPPQAETLWDEFVNASAEDQQEAIRAARELLERYVMAGGGSNTAGIDPRGTGGGSRGVGIDPNANLQRSRGGGSGGTNFLGIAAGGGHAAGTATTPASLQSSLFTLTQDVSDDAIEREAFTVPKHKREPEDSKLGRIQKENATTGMDDKFDVLVHQSTYSGGGESKMSANNQFQNN